jgi:hypothetical protein
MPTPVATPTSAVMSTSGMTPTSAVMFTPVVMIPIPSVTPDQHITDQQINKFFSWHVLTSIM